MTDCDEGGEYDDTQDEPRYLLLAREAEMLMMGGFNLDKDPQRSGKASFCFYYLYSCFSFPSTPACTPKIDFLLRVFRNIERVNTFKFNDAGCNKAGKSARRDLGRDRVVGAARSSLWHAESLPGNLHSLWGCSSGSLPWAAGCCL